MRSSNQSFIRLFLTLTIGSTLLAALAARLRRSTAHSSGTLAAEPLMEPAHEAGAMSSFAQAEPPLLRSVPPQPVAEPKTSDYKLGFPMAYRWLFFVGLFAGSVVLLMGPPSPVTTGILALMLIGSFVAAYITRPAYVPRANPRPTVFTVISVAVPYLLPLIAVGLMALSAYLFRPQDLGQNIGWGLVAMLLGGLALGLTLRLRRNDEIMLPVPTSAVRAEPLRANGWWLFSLGVFGLAITAEISGQVFNIEVLMHVNVHIQFVLLCVSCALIVIGLSGRQRWQINAPGWEIALIIGVLFIAFLIRLLQSGDTIRTLVDEVHFTTGIALLRWFPETPLLQPMSGLSPFPWIFPYWQSWTVALFGRTFFGFRAASAFIGTANILALYVLARALFDRKTAIISLVLMTAFPPHLHFSRIGIIQIADPLFATIGFAFLGRGLRHNHRLDYALGGMGIGLSQYFYEAGRLLFPPLTLAWVVLVAFYWRDRIGAHRRGLMIAALTFLLMTFPIYYTLLGLGAPLAERFHVSGLDSRYWNNVIAGTSDVFTLENYLTHFKAPFLFYVSTPDSSVYYGGQTPLILTSIVPIFLLGVFYALWRLRSPGMVLLLLWVLSVTLGNSLLVGSAVSSRYLVVFPPLALLIAVGIRYVLPLIPLPKLQPRYAYGLVGGLVAVLAVGQIGYYFGPHLEIYQIQSRLDWGQQPIKDIYDVALRAVDLPKGTKIHVIDDPQADAGLGNEVLSYMADDAYVMDGLLPRQLTPTYLANLTPLTDHAFFITPNDSETLAILRDYFVLEDPVSSPYPMPPGTQYILYYARYIKNPETIGNPVPK
jgi:hypothetical protein